MSRQARLVAELVNLAVPGKARGRSHQPAPDELLPAFGAVVTAATAERMAAHPGAGAELAKLAKAFHPVFATTEIRSAATMINDLLRRYRAQPYLVDDVGQPFHLHFHGDGSEVEALGGEFATALALVVDTYGETRFGICGAGECDRVYVDLTRNGARRYCSDACSARAKMAAYRERKARRP